MRSADDPVALTPQERLLEVATIFADGILRLRARAALPANPDQPSPLKNVADNSQDCLEVPGETVLSVHGG